MAPPDCMQVHAYKLRVAFKWRSWIYGKYSIQITTSSQTLSLCVEACRALHAPFVLSWQRAFVWYMYYYYFIHTTISLSFQYEIGIMWPVVSVHVTVTSILTYRIRWNIGGGFIWRIAPRTAKTKYWWILLWRFVQVESDYYSQNTR